MASADEPIGLSTGTVAWAALAPVRGREQGGHRPVVVVASQGYLDAVTTLLLVVPITTTDRGWPNHVPLDGAIGLQPLKLGHDRAGPHLRT